MGPLRSLGSVIWPAFLGAAGLEAVVFAMVDPLQPHLPAGIATELSPVAVYSIAFFVFWAIVAGACALTLMLERSAAAVNAGAGSNPPDAAGETGKALSSSGR